MTQSYDRLERRCPRLGHRIEFLYCRQEHGGIPCAAILRCWDHAPIHSRLEEAFPQRMSEIAHGSSPDKLCTVMECIDRARAGGE